MSVPISVSALIILRNINDKIEVRDSWTGYLIPARDGPGALPDVDSSWDVAAAAVAVIWKMPKYEEMHTFPKWACLKFPEMLICQK